MLSKLLVPLDGTPEAAVALGPARTLAKTVGGRITLLRVTSPGTRAVDEASEAAENLRRVAAELASDGIAVDTNVRQGEAAPAILAEARERGAEVIVMATHGRSGLGRALLGSVTERVLGESPVPVLLLRPGGHRVSQLKTLLVPVDGSPGGALALGAGLGLARATGATIVLLEVVVPAISYAYPSAYDVGFYIDPEWDEEARKSAQAYVDGMVERLRRAGVAAEGRTVLGRGGTPGSQVVDEIIRTADQTEADLIVMSTHALAGPVRTLLGSVADAVVRTSHRAVLLIRRDAPPSAVVEPIGEQAAAQGVVGD